jgi:hypothetical protein
VVVKKKKMMILTTLTPTLTPTPTPTPTPTMAVEEEEEEEEVVVVIRKTILRTVNPKRSPMTSRARPKASARSRRQHTSLHFATSSRKSQGQRMDPPPRQHLVLLVRPRSRKSRKDARSKGLPPRNSTAARRRRPPLNLQSTAPSRSRTARRTRHAPRQSVRCSRVARSLRLPRL